MEDEAMVRPKRGERRIDAAIDHLAKCGFPRTQIRKTIDDLLKVYGREGWMFLEEGSYHVLIEKLLEEQLHLQKDQQQEQAVDEAPLVPVLELHNEEQTEIELAYDEVEEPQQQVVAMGSISESNNEEEHTGQQHELHVSSTVGGFLCKRKQLE